ncbi:MAG: DUF3108 domain-containing protein [bacterium]
MKPTVPAKRFLAIVAVLCALSAPIPGARGQVSPKIPAREIFTYDVQVFIFPKAAQGTLRFIPVSKNRYRAELMAETKGIIGLITLYRKNHYISELEYVPEKSRFLSRHYTKLVHRGPNVERTTVSIDHEKGRVKWKIYFNDVLENQGVEPIPESVRYEDLLSAFFNFRGGAYGPLERGRKTTVLTLPDYADRVKNKDNPKKEDPYQKFEIRIADAETEKTYRKRYGREGEKGLLALVKVPKDLFGQETGEVRIWFDTNTIPVAVTVEDAIFFGDVHAFLRQPKRGR